MTEREKMEKGLWYDANYDTELVEKRLEAEELCFAFNHTRPKEVDQKEALLKKFFPIRERVLLSCLHFTRITAIIVG